MNYRKIISIILFIALFSIIISPINAAAANDDFDVEYSFSPEVVGFKGADVQLVLKIENTGSTDITWIDVVINTETTYTQRWTGTITPGSVRTISFLVHFGENDLDEDKILQVSMNNNSSANPDGLKMFNFQIDSITTFVGRTINISPLVSSYEIGDTVQVTYTFTNLITTHALINARTRLYVRVAGEVHSTSELINHGNIFPGDSVTHVITFVLDESYIGTMNITSNIACTLMGEDYSLSQSFNVFTLEAPEPDIGFSANLTAEPTEIESGETVMFYVNLENTGSDTITTYEIRNSEGGLMASTESMPSGGSGTVPLSAQIYETSDISYVVIAYSGDYYETEETNSVHITVVDPEPDTPVPTDTPSPTPSEETSAAATEDTPTPTLSPTPSESAYESEEADTTVLPSDLSENGGEMKKEPEGSRFGLFVLIVLSSLVAIAIIVVITIIICRKSSKNKGLDKFE